MNHDSSKHRWQVSGSCAKMDACWKSIWWFSFHTCSATADTSVFACLTAALCSFKRVSRDLEVCPTYTAGQVVHGMEYTTPDFIEDGTGSFGWTSCCLRVMCGRNITLTPTSNNTRWIASDRPLTYGITTRFLVCESSVGHEELRERTRETNWSG